MDTIGHRWFYMNSHDIYIILHFIFVIIIIDIIILDILFIYERH